MLDLQLHSDSSHTGT